MSPPAQVLVKFKNWALVVHGPYAAWIHTQEISPCGLLSPAALNKILAAPPDSAAREIARHTAIARARAQQARVTARTHEFHVRRRAAASHTVTLTSDAKYSHRRICVFADQLRRPLFSGPDVQPAHNQCQAEMNAAVKTLEIVNFLQGRLFPQGCAPCLTLKVDAESLLNSKSPRGYNTKLLQQAHRYNIGLNLRWIAGRDNPADRFTVGTGTEAGLLAAPQQLKALFQAVPPRRNYLLAAR